jgi:hypothetical protein
VATTQAILRTEEVTNTIEGFDRSTPSKMCDFLTATNSHLIDLTQEQCVAFKIYLERLAYGVPGQCIVWIFSIS